VKQRLEKIREGCQQAYSAGMEALNWIRSPENEQTVKPQREVLSREFRRHIVECRKLHDAIDRPMAIGVFGVSQAGKSYFIGRLISAADGVSHIRFDGVPGSFDFLSKMNPTGGAESTAVATRFTTKDEKTPPGFPVIVRLLSVSDLVQIVGDIYYTGFDIKDESELTAEDIEAAFESASEMPSAGSGVVKVEDLWVIRDFFHRKHRDKININALRLHDYWERAETIVEKLGSAGLVTLFEPIWAKFDGLSALFGRLIAALSSVDSADVLYCPLETLIEPTHDGYERHPASVINVESLHFLLSSEPGPSVEVTTRANRRAIMPRELLGALIAELRLTIVSHELPFLDEADVVDFPGLRTPEVAEEFRTQLDQRLFSRLFKDAKVRFLFERSKDDRELNALVLCIGPEMGEVPALPGLVQDWIASTHGHTPQERVGTHTALFVVLSKFDRHLEDKPGFQPVEHWEAVLKTALLDRLASQSDWLSNWTPGRAFPNVFWFRNTSMRNSSIMAYDQHEERRELGVNPAEAGRFAIYLKGYLQTPNVRKYIAEPQAAWDAVFKPNDGGLSRIVSALAPVCSPGLKAEQINARLSERRRIMRDRLAGYHVATDAGSQLKRAEANGRRIALAFAECAALGRIGRLMMALQVQDSNIVDRFTEIARRASLTARTMSANDILGAAGLSNDSHSAPAAGTLAEQLAAGAIEHWVGSMRAGVDDPRFRSFLHLPEAEHGILVDEIVSSSTRLDIKGSIAGKLREIVDKAAPGHSGLALAALVAADRINSFVYRLDFDNLEPAERPRRAGNGKTASIFSPTAARGVEGLSETASTGAREYYADWIIAFREAARANAEVVGGSRLNVVENERLQTILEQLAG
jgi:hypothetical protein